MTPRDSSGTRFELRGFERMFSMADHASLMNVHVVAMHGSAGVIQAFLAHLPQALVLTFNRHPRMRAMQVRDAFATAKIQPKLTLETLAILNLLEVREIAGRTSDEESASWETFAEVQANSHINRYTQLPFFFRVWHYPQQHKIRFILCCDHYMTDGVSAMALLNDIFSFASELSRSHREHQLAALVKTELPLRPSLYNMWLDSMPWMTYIAKTLVQLLGIPVYIYEAKQYTPLLPMRADQADLRVPIQVNPSSVLYGQGTPAAMKSALQRCKQEGVTFFGALTAAIVVAFFIACDEEKRSVSPFKVAVEAVANMRPRVAEPAPEVQVGAYMDADVLKSFAKEGVDMEGSRFWDLARKSRSEIDAVLQGYLAPLRMMFLDEHLHSELKQESVGTARVVGSCTADILISNIGRYGYTTAHAFETANHTLEELQIDSVHAAGSLPHIGSAVGIYITSFDRMNFGFVHKYDDALGKQLFEAMLAAIERIGHIGSEDTMADVVRVVE